MKTRPQFVSTIKKGERKREWEKKVGSIRAERDREEERDNEIEKKNEREMEREKRRRERMRKKERV